MTSLSKPIAALALSAFVLTACGDSSDPAPAEPNIVQAAQATPDLSILVEAVVAADLAGTLSGPGPFTVFAPTNAAFAALLTELGVTKAQLLADKPLLTTVLTYHVLAGEVLKAQVPAGKAITSLQGGIFKIDAAGAALTITDGRNRTSNIVATDIQVANGVVHLIDRVILPADKNIVETAQALAAATPAEFTILVEAVVAADLAGTLSGPGPFTVFAPTDAAFAALLTELGISKQALLADTALLTKVLTYHVLPARALKADIVPGPQPATVQGQAFSISASLMITDGRARMAGIAATDVLASNGVVHVIDKVILPTPNVVEAAQATPDLSILVEAVVAADLAGTLSGPGPFTVFAPTNAAFAALLGELGVTKDQLLADKPLLTAVLTYHVLAGKVLKADVPAGKAIASLQGGIFKIDAAGAALTITDGRNRTAGITATDIQVANGVVHLIDRVILPANKNIVETAQSVPDFSILVEAVVAADLAGTLSGPGPFTVFAPTNAAFAALLTELGITKAALLADKALLTAVLTYHVLPARALKADVVPGTQPATVQGGTFSISAALDITDARMRTSSIVATDVFASNGVIHVIDTVILPAP